MTDGRASLPDALLDRTVIGRLEHRDLVPSVQEVRDHEAGYAGADDGDLHRGLTGRRRNVTLMIRSDTGSGSIRADVGEHPMSLPDGRAKLGGAWQYGVVPARVERAGDVRRRLCDQLAGDGERVDRDLGLG